MRVISLGAGVQSSAMLLMALEGRFGDFPDAAVFADTQCEPSYVYAWLEKLIVAVAPFPIYRVSEGNLIEDYIGGRRRAAIPAFSTTHEGKPMMMSRFCSKSYKVEPIRRKVRELVGPKGTAESWIGISTDEAHRGFKPSGLRWLQHRYPLLDAGLSRTDCHEYVLARMGEAAPKSACIVCPFADDSRRLFIKTNYPEEHEESCLTDDRIRDMDNDRWDRPRYLHRSLKALRQVDLMHEHQGSFFEDAFGNECDGVCGL